MFRGSVSLSDRINQSAAKGCRKGLQERAVIGTKHVPEFIIYIAAPGLGRTRTGKTGKTCQTPEDASSSASNAAAAQQPAERPWSTVADSPRRPPPPPPQKKTRLKRRNFMLRSGHYVAS